MEWETALMVYKWGHRQLHQPNELNNLTMHLLAGGRGEAAQGQIPAARRVSPKRDADDLEEMLERVRPKMSDIKPRAAQKPTDAANTP